jgi:hypothetical protein
LQTHTICPDLSLLDFDCEVDHLPKYHHVFAYFDFL